MAKSADSLTELFSYSYLKKWCDIAGDQHFLLPFNEKSEQSGCRQTNETARTAITVKSDEGKNMNSKAYRQPKG